MKHALQEPDSDSDESVEEPQGPLRQSVMQRKLQLMKKRAQLAMLKQHQDKMRYYGMENCGTTKHGQLRRVGSQPMILEHLIQEIQNEEGKYEINGH